MTTGRHGAVEDHSEHLRLELELLEGGERLQDTVRNAGEAGGAVILAAGPDAELRAYVARCLASDGDAIAAVVEAADGASAWRMLERRRIDLVVAEAEMPGIDGLELCRRLDRRVPVVLVVNDALTREVGERLRGGGAAGVVSKPFNARRLCTVVWAALAGAARGDGSGRDEAPER